MSMPFKFPKSYCRIFSAQLAGVEDESVFRDRVQTVENKVDQAIAENMKQGFFSLPGTLMDPKGNLLVIVFTDPSRRVPVEPEIERVPAGAVILGKD